MKILTNAQWKEIMDLLHKHMNYDIEEAINILKRAENLALDIR